MPKRSNTALTSDTGKSSTILISTSKKASNDERRVSGIPNEPDYPTFFPRAPTECIASRVTPETDLYLYSIIIHQRCRVIRK